MNDLSIQQLLFEDGLQSLKFETREAKQSLNEIRDRIKAELPRGDWGRIQEQLISHLETLLDIPLGEILVGSWNKMREVRKIINQQMTSGSDKLDKVELYQHKIKSEHHPKLQVLLNGHEIQSIDLTVDLEFKLKAVVLEIRYGKIQKLASGSCTLTGKIKYMGAIIHDKTIVNKQLPGNIRLQSDEKQASQQIELNEPIDTAQLVQQKPKRTRWFLLIGFGVICLLAGFLYWRLINL